MVIYYFKKYYNGGGIPVENQENGEHKSLKYTQ